MKGKPKLGGNTRAWRHQAGLTREKARADVRTREVGEPLYGATHRSGSQRESHVLDFNRARFRAGFGDRAGTAARHGAAIRESASSRTRTLDPLIKSQSAQVKGQGVARECPHSGPQSAAEPAPAAGGDPDLAAVVAAWPTLPAAVRAGVVALVRATVRPN